MKVSFGNSLISQGQLLSWDDAQLPISIEYTLVPSTFYTIIVYDPDAPMGTFTHWIAINDTKTTNGMNLLSYIPPNPPDKIHRYYIYIYKQSKKYNNINLLRTNGQKFIENRHDPLVDSFMFRVSPKK